jgi:hypothetical protein
MVIPEKRIAVAGFRFFVREPCAVIAGPPVAGCFYKRINNVQLRYKHIRHIFIDSLFFLSKHLFSDIPLKFVPIFMILVVFFFFYIRYNYKTQMFTHRHTYTRERTHTLERTHTHTHTSTRAHTHTHTRTHTQTHTHTHKHARAHTHTHTRTHTHTHAHTHANTHTHTYTHTTLGVRLTVGMAESLNQINLERVRNKR